MLVVLSQCCSKQREGTSYLTMMLPFNAGPAFHLSLPEDLELVNSKNSRHSPPSLSLNLIKVLLDCHDP